MLFLGAISIVTAFAFGYLFLTAVRRDRAISVEPPPPRPAISVADSFFELALEDAITEEVDAPPGSPAVRGAWFHNDPTTASVPVFAPPVRGPSVCDPPSRPRLVLLPRPDGR